MAIEDMIKRIMAEARDENDRILGEAKGKADSIRSRAQKELYFELQELNKKLEREAANTRNIYISDGRRKARQALLSSKEELIWDAICAIRKRIKELDGEELERYLGPMMDRSKEMLGGDFQVFPIRDRDANILSKRIKVSELLDKVLDDEGPLSRFRGTDMLGGFVAISKDGDRIIDMTFHGLLERNEERIRETIARILFGDVRS
ncbi:MAG: V-type ATP synthase subunit E [Thermoplasmatota archaeon]